MARLPRLALPGLPHLASLYGQPGLPIAVDDQDRNHLLAALREAARQQRVAVHAYVLHVDHLHLLVTPAEAAALGAMMQGLGRRYVAAFNRRHARAGSLWSGRFRATVVQPGATTLEALLFIDGHATRHLQRTGAPEAADGDRSGPWSSAPHHLGRLRDPLLTPVDAYWQLGNTPFEREAAYRRLLDDGLPAARLHTLADAARHGWPVGDAAFLAALAQRTDRPLARRPRGRPRRPSPA